MELTVGRNRLSRHLIEGNVLGAQAWGRGNGHGVTQTIRVVQAPLKCLHTTKGTSHHGGPTFNAEPVGQQRLAVDPVAYRDHREIRAVGLAGLRIDAAGSGAAMAATQIVQADNEKPVGIDGLAGANAAVPPSRLAVFLAVITGGMVVAAEGVTDQYRVGGIRIQLAVSLNHQIVTLQRLTAGESDRCIEVQCLWGDYPDRIRWQGIGHWRDRFLIQSVLSGRRFRQWPGGNLHVSAGLTDMARRLPAKQFKGRPAWLQPPFPAPVRPRRKC